MHNNVGEIQLEISSKSLYFKIKRGQYIAKEQWTSSKFKNRLSHLGILGLKITLLALKVMQWPILLKGTDLGHSKFKDS